MIAGGVQPAYGSDQRRSGREFPDPRTFVRGYRTWGCGSTLLLRVGTIPERDRTSYRPTKWDLYFNALV